MKLLFDYSNIQRQALVYSPNAYFLELDVAAIILWVQSERANKVALHKNTEQKILFCSVFSMN